MRRRRAISWGSLSIVEALDILDPPQRGAADPFHVGGRVVEGIEREVDGTAAHEQESGARQEVLRTVAPALLRHASALQHRLHVRVAPQLAEERGLPLHAVQMLAHVGGTWD